MSITPEGRVKKECRQLLDQIGYRFSPVQTGYGKRTLDDLCCVGGKFVAVEYKREDEDFDKFQRAIAIEIRQRGGIVILAHSRHELEMELRALGMITGLL